jgi:Pentapeptide repeats (8 copies)
MLHTSPCKEGRQVDDQQQSRSRPTRRQILWYVGILAFIVGAYIFLRFAYVDEWKWTGLVKDPDFHKRTLWDWLNLLIVPAVLALGGYLFTRSENRATQAAAERRAQVDALQAYLDHMSDMLIPKTDQPSLYKARPGDSLSSVARARTFTVLPRLDGDRKARVVQFLYESGLIAKNRPIVDMRGADLRGAVLRAANLSEADLGGAVLSADLNYHGTVPIRADLSGADLSGAVLNEAVLSGARLSEARGWTEEQLRAASSLEGATMPNGQKYEDWLKSKGKGEDGKNSGPS